MTGPVPTEALVDGDHDMPTDAEVQAMREEAENFRLPAPPPTPVRGRFYLTECEYCGWVGSSEHCGGNCGPDDDDIVCPVCCSSICGDTPDEADTAKHGEAVYQRIVTVEASLATATSELARLRADMELLSRVIDMAKAEVAFAQQDEIDGSSHASRRVRFRSILDALNGVGDPNARTALARAATAREGA